MSLGPGAKFPGGGLAATAYVPVGRPFFDNLIYAMWLILFSRLAVGWIVGRPKNNSKLRSSDGSCKGRKGNSLNPGRFICGLGGSGGRSESSCWHGVEGRKHHGAVILSHGRGRTDRVYLLSRVLMILVVLYN